MSRTEAVAILVVALVVVTVGCVTVPTTDEATPSAAELQTEIAAAEPPEMATATLESVHATADGTTTYDEEIWMHTDGRTAVETTTAAGDRYTNVDDGEYAWFYDHGADRVSVLDSERTGESHFEFLYDEQQRYFEDLDATNIDVTTVAGRETYHVTFEPPSETDPAERTITVLVGDTEYVVPLESGDEDAGDETDDSSTADDAGSTPAVEQIDVWIDQETLFPVKQELVSADGTERSWTYANLSFDEDVDAERFEFKPPTDAVVEKDIHPMGTPMETVADAEDAVNVSVAEPTWLPDDLAREDVEAAEYFFEDVREATIRYGADDGRSIVLAVSSPERPHDYDADGESVTIGTDADSWTATQVESQFGTQLQWTCDGQGYYLFATEEFGPKTVQEVAESIDCS